MVLFGPNNPSSIKKTKIGPPLTKFSGSAYDHCLRTDFTAMEDTQIGLKQSNQFKQTLTDSSQRLADRPRYDILHLRNAETHISL